jgi:hypothetical protein
MADVFISYKHEEKERIRVIADALGDLKLSIWFDREIPAGESYETVIKRELTNARAVLVCWSKAAAESPWVKAEASRALAKGKLVPCFLEACEVPMGFEFTQTEDVSDWNGELEHLGWRKTVDAIGKLVQRPGLASLLVARANGRDDVLLQWAQSFPDDPYTLDLWKPLEKRERERFKEELSAVQKNIDAAIDKWKEIRQASLNGFSVKFEEWIADLKHVSYDKRPQLNAPPEASGPSLSTDALRDLEVDRDAARSEVLRLKSDLDVAVAKAGEVKPSATKNWFALAGALLLGGLLGVGGGARFAGAGPDGEEALQRLRQEFVAVNDQRDKAEMTIRDLRQQIETEKKHSNTEASDLKTRLDAAERGRRVAEERHTGATSNVNDAQSQLSQKLMEISQLTKERDRLAGQLEREISGREEAEKGLKFAKSRLAELAELEKKQPESSRKMEPLSPPSASAAVGEMIYKTISHCTLEVGGEMLIDSKCSFGQTKGANKTTDRTLSISGSAGGKYSYKSILEVRVKADGRQVASGFVEGGTKGGQRPLKGAFEPDGPNCWVNTDRSVRWCAK